MFFAKLILATFLLYSGCSGTGFTNIGNGIGVPTDSIDQYAEKNGVSRQEAIEAIRTQIETRDNKNPSQ